MIVGELDGLWLLLRRVKQLLVGHRAVLNKLACLVLHVDQTVLELLVDLLVDLPHRIHLVVVVVEEVHQVRRVAIDDCAPRARLP